LVMAANFVPLPLNRSRAISEVTGASKVAQSRPVSGSTRRTEARPSAMASILPSAVKDRTPAWSLAPRRAMEWADSQEPTFQKRYSLLLPVTSHLLSGLKATWALSFTGNLVSNSPLSTFQIHTSPYPKVPAAIHRPSRSEEHTS